MNLNSTNDLPSNSGIQQRQNSDHIGESLSKTKLVAYLTLSCDTVVWVFSFPERTSHDARWLLFAVSYQNIVSKFTLKLSAVFVLHWCRWLLCDRCMGPAYGKQWTKPSQVKHKMTMETQFLVAARWIFCRNRSIAQNVCGCEAKPLRINALHVHWGGKAFKFTLFCLLNRNCSKELHFRRC